MEFYVGERGPIAQFSAEEVTAIADRASTGLSVPKALRVRNVLSEWLNRLSITARLQHALAEDGVPVTEADLALLRRLRKQRNRAVHGAIAEPAHDDIDRVLAFMSRAITTRWYHQTASNH